MTEDVEAIAGRLSKAQREALTRWPERDNGNVWAYDKTMRVLEREKLAFDRVGGSGWARLTPLGKAVRSSLVSKEQSSG